MYERHRSSQPARETDLYMTALGPLKVEIHSNTVELEADDPNKAAVEGNTLTYTPGAPSSATSLYRYPNGHRLGFAS